MNLGIHALLSLTSSMFQYLVMRKISGYSSISIASCSPITRFFSSASIKSRIFLPKRNEPELYVSAFNIDIFLKDQVYFILFFAADFSFASSLFTPDITPLTGSWTKQLQAYDFSVQASYLSCLWAFLNKKSALSFDLIQWKNCLPCSTLFLPMLIFGYCHDWLCWACTSA